MMPTCMAVTSYHLAPGNQSHLDAQRKCERATSSRAVIGFGTASLKVQIARGASSQTSLFDAIHVHVFAMMTSTLCCLASLLHPTNLAIYSRRTPIPTASATATACTDLFGEVEVPPSSRRVC